MSTRTYTDLLAACAVEAAHDYPVVVTAFQRGINDYLSDLETDGSVVVSVTAQHVVCPADADAGRTHYLTATIIYTREVSRG